MFEKALLGAILKENPEYIHVDYSPDKYLQTAADFAKITDINSRLPVKTTTWVETLLVRKGYNGEVLSVPNYCPKNFLTA